MKPPVINDTTYTSHKIDKVRQYLIGLRDEALDATCFDHAVQLSVTIALISELRKAVASAGPCDHYGEPA